MQFLDAFKDPDLARGLLARLAAEAEPLRFMEVCGTHTVAIFQSGLHSLLPEGFVHLTGPGCPVCVTHEREVAAYLQVAGAPGVIMATFGDLMKVPGPKGVSLKAAQAEGADVRVVYSPVEALSLAARNPERTVVFIGVGFETTAPAIAATIKEARRMGLGNFKVLSFHKLVPPALRVLLADPEMRIQGFILPGHVVTVTGIAPFQFLAEDYAMPAVAAGFEATDILQALVMLGQMRREGKPAVRNQYTRVASNQGNPKARAVLEEVFTPGPGLWRGIGEIPDSGLALSPQYAEFDALAHLGMTLPDAEPTRGCRCGDVLKGKLPPSDCPLFGKACTPARPVGPCMVSTEGSCAAYFKYNFQG